MSGLGNLKTSPVIKKNEKVQVFVSILHSCLESVILFVIVMQWNMQNCLVIIFGHAVIQRNSEHMQKQEDQCNVNNLCCSQCTKVANLVICHKI